MAGLAEGDPVFTNGVGFWGGMTHLASGSDASHSVSEADAWVRLVPKVWLGLAD